MSTNQTPSAVVMPNIIMIVFMLYTWEEWKYNTGQESAVDMKPSRWLTEQRRRD